MLSKQDYQIFCASAPDLPVFHEPWFLDAVCGPENWAAVAAERGGQRTGAWPFFLKKKMGKTWVATPMLLRYLGPYLLPQYRTVRHQNQMFKDMLNKMPDLASFEQDIHPMTQNGLAMHWADYELHTRYTYVVNQIQDSKLLWKNLANDYRNNKIPKADSHVLIEESKDIELCYRLQAMSYERQGLPMPFTLDFLRNLHGALSEHGQSLILVAKDKEDGQIHAACYMLHDKQSAYYLLAGDNPDLRTSGAGILLAWEAIRYAGDTLGLDRFDFLGSMVESIERVRRNFGAEQQPYLRVRKDWSKLFKAKRAWKG